MNINATTILNFVGYTIAVLIAGVGIAVLIGVLLPSYIAVNIRMLVGVMMVIYGIFRGSMIWMKQRQAKRFAERYEQDDEH